MPSSLSQDQKFIIKTNYQIQSRVGYNHESIISTEEQSTNTPTHTSPLAKCGKVPTKRFSKMTSSSAEKLFPSSWGGGKA